MVQTSRHRMDKMEDALAPRRKRMGKKVTAYIDESRASARHHATAVAAIVLAGQAKIDEPLDQAWARALQHYNIDNNNGRELENQIAAAQQLRPKIIGREKDSTRFTDIFGTAPVWLLQFTGMAWDAGLLKFQLPEVSQRLSWGSAGYEEARRWPLLPSGVMEAGDPIPPNDSRSIWIFAVCETIIPILDEDTLLQAAKEYRSQPVDPTLEGLSLLLDLESNPERELSRYEKRLLRKAYEFLARYATEEEALRSIVSIARGDVRGSATYPCVNSTPNSHHAKRRLPKDTALMDKFERRVEQAVQAELSKLRMIPGNVRLAAWIEVLNRGHGKPFQSVMANDEKKVTVTFKDADELKRKLIDHGVSPALFESELPSVSADAVRREAEEDAQEYLREEG
jgi:hypothetical protein